MQVMEGVGSREHATASPLSEQLLHVTVSTASVPSWGTEVGGWVWGPSLRPIFHCLLCFGISKNDGRMLLSTTSNCLDFRLFLPVFSKHLLSSPGPTFIALRCNRKEHRLEPVHIRWNTRDINYELCKFG